MDKYSDLSLESLKQAENIDLKDGNGCCSQCCGNCRYFNSNREWCGYRSVYTKAYDYCERWED